MSSNGGDAQSDLGNEPNGCEMMGSSSGDNRSSISKKRSASAKSDNCEKPGRRTTKAHRRSHHDGKIHKNSKKRRRIDDDHYDKSSDSGSRSISDDDFSYAERRRRRRRRDEKKHSKKKKDGSKDDKRKREHRKIKARDRPSDNDMSSTPTFGQYGILKASDIGKMQRSFEVWLSEIHGVHLSTTNIPKYELQQYFDTYREDFNTATLPHVKFYDYDKWELEEHYKLRQSDAMKDSISPVLGDERAHAKKLQVLAKQKELTAMQVVASSMNASKIADMQEQKQLQAQMQVAFKMGDSEAYRKLKEKLQPMDK